MYFLSVGFSAPHFFLSLLFLFSVTCTRVPLLLGAYFNFSRTCEEQAFKGSHDSFLKLPDLPAFGKSTPLLCDWSSN